MEKSKLKLSTNDNYMITLEQLRDFMKQASGITNFGELDTIERFVTPVLELSGWSIESLNPMYLLRGNRDNRSANRRFDIELYLPTNEYPKFVFECKKLHANIQLIGKGSSDNLSDHSDFVRQLRNDCLNSNFKYKPGWSVPVLTNGQHWIIFKKAFTDNKRKNENISEQNMNDFILTDCNIGDDNFTKIIETLRFKDA